MQNEKFKKIITIAVIFIAVIIGISSFAAFKAKKNESAVQKTTQLYIHHFDVVLTLEQAFGDSATSVATMGGDNWVNINFNVISKNGKAYQKLSDMDGDGYIISAFGAYLVSGQPIAVFDARLVNEGRILIYVTTQDGSVQTLIVSEMGDHDIHPNGVAGDHVTAL